MSDVPCLDKAALPGFGVSITTRLFGCYARNKNNTLLAFPHVKGCPELDHTSAYFRVSAAKNSKTGGTDQSSKTGGTDQSSKAGGTYRRLLLPRNISKGDKVDVCVQIPPEYDETSQLFLTARICRVNTTSGDVSTRVGQQKLLEEIKTPQGESVTITEGPYALESAPVGGDSPHHFTLALLPKAWKYVGSSGHMKGKLGYTKSVFDDTKKAESIGSMACLMVTVFSTDKCAAESSSKSKQPTRVTCVACIRSTAFFIVSTRHVRRELERNSSSKVLTLHAKKTAYSAKRQLMGVESKLHHLPKRQRGNANIPYANPGSSVMAAIPAAISIRSRFERRIFASADTAGTSNRRSWPPDRALSLRKLREELGEDLTTGAHAKFREVTSDYNLLRYLVPSDMDVQKAAHYFREHLAVRKEFRWDLIREKVMQIDTHFTERFRWDFVVGDLGYRVQFEVRLLYFKDGFDRDLTSIGSLINPVSGSVSDDVLVDSNRMECNSNGELIFMEFRPPEWTASAPSCALHLLVRRGGETLDEIRLTSERPCVTFGRSGDVVLLHDSVSRMHAAIVHDHSSRKPYLIDLGSSNGTFIGDSRLPSWTGHSAKRALNNGDIIRFGASTRLYIVAGIGTPVSPGQQGRPTNHDDTNVQQKRTHSKMETEGADRGRIKKMSNQKGGDIVPSSQYITASRRTVLRAQGAPERAPFGRLPLRWCLPTPCSLPLRGIGTVSFSSVGTDGTRPSAGVPALPPPLARASKCVRSADVYRLAVSGEIDIARDILEYEMPDANITPDSRAARVMKMSAGELEEERRRLLVDLMVRKPDSVSMLVESMRKNTVLPGDMEGVVREYEALERNRERVRKTLTINLKKYAKKYKREMDPKVKESALNAIFEADRSCRKASSSQSMSDAFAVVTAAHFEQYFMMLDSSQEMKEVMKDHMESLRIAPSSDILKVLANQLMIEGDRHGADAVVSRELRHAISSERKLQHGEFSPPAASGGSRKQSQKRRIFLLSPQTKDYKLSRIRVDKLQKLFSLASPFSWRLAHEFYATLLENGVASPYQHNVMIKYSFATSDEMFASARKRDSTGNDGDSGGNNLPTSVAETVSGGLPTHDVDYFPFCNTSAYTILVRQLIFEGNREAAKDLMYTGMPQAGVPVSSVTEQSLDMSDAYIREMRVVKVSQLVCQGQPEKAQAFLSKLKDNGLHREAEQLQSLVNDPLEAESILKEFKRETAAARDRSKRAKTGTTQQRNKKRVQPPAPHNHVYNDKAVSLCHRIKTLGVRWRFGKLPSAKVEAFQLLNEAILKDEENLTSEEETTVNNLVFHSFLKFAETSDDIQHIMENTMPKVGLTPDLPMYAALIEKLVIEGDWESASKVLYSNMADAKLKPDKVTYIQLHKPCEVISNTRKKKMVKAFQAGTSEGFALAKDFFERLHKNHKHVMSKYASGQDESKKHILNAKRVARIDTMLFNVYMLNVMNTASDMRNFIGLSPLVPTSLTRTTSQTIDASPHNAISCVSGASAASKSAGDLKFAPDIGTFIILATQLMIEGNVDQARNLPEQDMALAQVQPNFRFSKVLELSHKELTRMRTKKIKTMVKQGLEKEAHRLISIMEENGVAAGPFTDVIEEVRGRRTGTAGLGKRQLLLEKLNNCLHEWREYKNPSAKLQALEAFEAAAKKGSRTVVDEVHFETILKFLPTSKEQLRVIQTDMPKFSVKPSALCYAQVVNTLLIEGDSIGARSLIDNDMSEAGIHADQEMQERVNGGALIEENLERVRHRMLRKALCSRTPAGLEEGEELFSLMRRHGVAKSCHFELILEHGCVHSDVIRDAIASGEFQPEESLYRMLVDRLLIEGDVESAKIVMDDCIRVAGVPPNTETMRALEGEEARSDAKFTELREQEVQRMILLGRSDAAKAFLKRLESNGVVMGERSKPSLSTATLSGAHRHTTM
eukprot:g3662.t1